ncbi:MAG: ACP synthase [Myxococcaceae bacterium]
MMNQSHPGELKLRRLSAGELAGPENEADRAHAAACPQCSAKLRAVADEQRRFEAAIPFERFAAGVERAARTPRAAPVPRGRWLYPLVAMAAVGLISVSAHRLVAAGQPGFNNLKGGGIEVVVAGAGNGPQRQASADPFTPEALSPGERVRIGYKTAEHRFLTSVSIDEQGQVTALYPEAGLSLPAKRDRQLHYLPNSLVFTGKGNERLVVILSDEPLEVTQVENAAREAFDSARGDLSRIDRLEVPGEQFHRTFLKP